MRVIVGRNDSVTIGRSKPLPKSDRCEPSEAIVEFELVVLNVPNVKNGKYRKPFISCSVGGEKPSMAGSKLCAGSRYSPKREKLTRVSKSSVPLSVLVYPPFNPTFVR